MQAMIEVTNPLTREQAMTKVQDKAKVVAIKELLARDEDFVRSAVQSFVQAALEAGICSGCLFDAAWWVGRFEYLTGESGADSSFG